MIRAILCDIEGTTTSLSFAKDVLFPISRKEMRSFVQNHWNEPEMRTLFESLGKQTPDEVIDLLHSWIDTDSKEGILKQIQGKIWKKSFENDEIRSHVYPDVPKKWSEWKDRGIKIYIFSSGSIEAQELIFRHTEYGDLTPFIHGYFDTTTGPKKDADSYRQIAAVMQVAPDDILFLSDIAEELDAARNADMQTIHVVRDNEPVQSTHPRAASFDEILHLR